MPEAKRRGQRHLDWPRRSMRSPHIWFHRERTYKKEGNAQRASSYPVSFHTVFASLACLRAYGERSQRRRRWQWWSRKRWKTKAASCGRIFLTSSTVVAADPRHQRQFWLCKRFLLIEQWGERTSSLFPLFQISSPSAPASPHHPAAGGSGGVSYLPQSPGVINRPPMVASRPDDEGQEDTGLVGSAAKPTGVDGGLADISYHLYGERASFSAFPMQRFSCSERGGRK